MVLRGRCCRTHDGCFQRRGCMAIGLLMLLALTSLQTLFIVVLIKLESFDLDYGSVLGARKAITNGLFHCDHLQGNAEFREEIWGRIQDIYSSVSGVSHWDNRTKFSLQQRLWRLATLVNAYSFPKFSKPDLKVSKGKGISCATQFKGALFDYPEYLNEWKAEKCDHEVALSRLVTFVIVFSAKEGENLSGQVQDLITSIHKSPYQDLPILVASDDSRFHKTVTKGNFIRSFHRSNIDVIQTWNDMVDQVRTPFVFIARNMLALDPYSHLRRPLTMLSTYPGIAAILFGHRKANRFWHADCYQATLKNYELSFRTGYYESFNESMVCHYGDGPFVASANKLKKVRLDRALMHDSIAFLDFFLRIKAENYLVVNTPDYMVLTPNEYGIQSDRRKWIPFSRKWQFNTIRLPSIPKMDFDCRETHLVCKPTGYTDNGLMVPLCCLRAKSKMVNDVINYCEKLNIPAELDSGTIMSAVKFQRQSSWDLDEDVCIIDRDKDKFDKNALELAKKGPYIVKIDHSGFTVRYKDQPYSGLKIDIFAMKNHITLGNTRGGHYAPTRVHYHGVIGNIPYNPALFLRGRYGPNYLKHAPSWISAGYNTSFYIVTPGKFIPCVLPGHHACLDQYEADGNLDFGDL